VEDVASATNRPFAEKAVTSAGAFASKSSELFNDDLGGPRRTAWPRARAGVDLIPQIRFAIPRRPNLRASGPQSRGGASDASSGTLLKSAPTSVLIDMTRNQRSRSFIPGGPLTNASHNLVDQVVPEPATVVLGAVGAAWAFGLAARHRRSRPVT